MNPVMETAVIALGLNALASTWALVYVVRRVSPHPRQPAQAQPRKTAAASSIVPPGGTS